MTYIVRPGNCDDLVALKHWLKEERAETGEGFYCNWTLIEKSLNDNELFLLGDEADIIGFVVMGTSGA
jgi:hypothetical protein